MAKRQRTAEEIYNSNKTKAKVCRILAPIVFWAGIILGIVFLVLAIKNSIGNVAEIIQKLDSKNLTGEQVEQNYNYLVEKYGEWMIGRSGAFHITFINIAHALFSGLATFCLVMAVVVTLTGIVFGKWILPIASKNIDQKNQDTVNLTILKNSEKQE